MESLARRTGAAEEAGLAPQLPAQVRLRACIDGAEEAECVAAHLRAWRLSGIPAEATAILAARRDVAETLRRQALAQGAPAEGVRVGELGLADTDGLRALALVGCDSRFAPAADPEAGDFAAPVPEQDRIRPVLRTVAAPREALLITWRGRPERLFGALAES